MRKDFFCNFQKQMQAQKKIYQMGYEKTDKVSHHAVLRQQIPQKEHIHGRGQDIEPDTNFLLSQSLRHGICNGIAVEHRNQEGV